MSKNWLLTNKRGDSVIDSLNYDEDDVYLFNLIIKYQIWLYGVEGLLKTI